MNNGAFYSVLENNNIVRYSYKTGLAVDTLFNFEYFKKDLPEEISEYEFSKDESRILLTTNESYIYRRSYCADYFIFDCKLKKIIRLSDNGKQQLASFSPDNKKVAFVRNNNLFIKNLESLTETAVTTDGLYNHIINGAPDWVYEEEFGFSKAYEWSTNGNELAFMRFDETDVPLFSMIKYDSLYPSVYTFKYPKAGEANSLVSVHVFNTQTGKTATMDVGPETNQYIPRIKWTQNEGTLSIIRLNRLQNHVEVLLAQSGTGTSRVIYNETNKYFISEVSDQFINFTSDGKYFIIQSERTGYNHLYKYGINGNLIMPLTSGAFDVTEILAINDIKQQIYYVSTEVSSLSRDVYSCSFDGKNKKRISAEDGTSTAEFSTDFKYYILIHSNSNKPPIYTLFNEAGNKIRFLEDNVALKKRMADCNFQPKEFIQVPVDDNLKLNGYIIKPPHFEPSHKYPLFMFVYGGPQSQEVADQWDRNLAWFQYLANKGYVVACVDNRGTDGRGEEFRKCTYLQLGKLETEDQINAAHYLGKLSYIDSSRIGIFGWSYGGYMSSLCMTKGNGTFKMGIAVAPVTNWRYYDNIYTERFMRTPQENPDGYDNNSPINFAAQLKGAFLLIHGSADDNVHLQNTMMFSEKLVQAGIKFDEAIYKDRNHSIYGGNTRFHLYSRMTDYILKNL
jgi:dipeptidyl-peptidase 4